MENVGKKDFHKVIMVNIALKAKSYSMNYLGLWLIISMELLNI